MNTKQTEALTLALEAICGSGDFLFNWHDCEPNNEREMQSYQATLAANEKAFKAIKEALAEQLTQQQEPVAWITKNGKGWLRWHKPEDSEKNKDSIPLYTAPTSKPWVGLTDDEIALICAECSLRTPCDIYYARAIEAKLKEKNI